MTSINAEQVREAQDSWAEAIMGIGSASSWEESHELATQLARSLYLLDGTLLFCPTKAAERQFRASIEDVVSYFVGRDENNPEDRGFARTRLSDIRFENTGIVCGSEHAMAMGNYFFINLEGDELKAEFSFVYIRGAAGDIKIQLHHSALPYSGQ
jgi:hypothetical protein